MKGARSPGPYVEIDGVFYDARTKRARKAVDKLRRAVPIQRWNGREWSSTGTVLEPSSASKRRARWRKYNETLVLKGKRARAAPKFDIIPAPVREIGSCILCEEPLLLREGCVMTLPHVCKDGASVGSVYISWSGDQPKETRAKARWWPTSLETSSPGRMQP